MFKAFIGFLLSTLGFAQISHAYFVAVPKDQGAIDYKQPTRILVSGRGSTLGTQPQHSAMGAALLLKRNFPSHQVVMLSVFENSKNEASLVSAGWKIVSKNNLKFETQVASAEIKKFTHIRSLEFFGHNSPTLGTQTDGLGFRFDMREPVVAQLAPNFDNGAYAMIHGCNSGWILAQTLSKTWNIPVAGSFTGTRFERLHSDGHFYVDEPGKQPNTKWATRNDDLGGISCESGACLRMRPAYAPYNGHWGDLEGPILSHYKFFCQLDVKVCEKRMASFMYSYLAERSLTPQATLNEFRDVVKEYLCPMYKDRKLTTECYSQLDKVERGQGNKQVSFVVRNKQLVCNLRGCSGKMTCDDHTCTIENRDSKNSTTLADEYMHFIRGFEILQSEGL